ncbi:MAG: DUF2306 domain-containing protein [Alphaproteobacteria bacterium]|nr:DUF2306 domain-containing protein [Alphaproteobacteria bacterium]
MAHILQILRIFVAYFIISIACFLMLRLIVGYLEFRGDEQFLAYKQDYIGNPVWKTAFYVHVFTAVLALSAGFTQFSQELLREHTALHRFMGKLYVFNILFINVPVGMVLAIYANGQLVGKTAFVLLDCLWFWFTYRAYQCVRQKKFAEHKRFMIRSFALTFSAITLRSWKEIISHSFTIDIAQLYMIDAWLGFVPNLIVSELVIRKRLH